MAPGPPGWGCESLSFALRFAPGYHAKFTLKWVPETLSNPHNICHFVLCNGCLLGTDIPPALHYFSTILPLFFHYSSTIPSVLLHSFVRL